MSANRVQKRSRSAAHPQTLRRNDLLESILRAPKIMPNTCSYCEQRGLSCELSSSESSRCAACVRGNQARCDVLGVSPAQLRNIASQHAKLESALEKVEAEMEAMAAKAQRLRRQKRVWYEKMSRAISRGIDSVEELEALERAEAAAFTAPEFLTDLPAPSSFGGSSDTAEPLVLSAADWAALGVDPSLLADPDFVGGTAGASPGNSSSRGVPTS